MHMSPSIKTAIAVLSTLANVGLLFALALWAFPQTFVESGGGRGWPHFLLIVLLLKTYGVIKGEQEAALARHDDLVQLKLRCTIAEIEARDKAERPRILEELHDKLT